MHYKICTENCNRKVVIKPKKQLSQKVEKKPHEYEFASKMFYIFNGLNYKSNSIV